MPKLNLISPYLWQTLPHKDPDAWRVFLAEHEAWHRELQAEVKRVFGKQTPFGALDDLRENRGVHQLMHDGLADAIGGARSVSLDVYDLEDETQFNTFMHLHSIDHQRFRLALGL